MNDMEFDDEAVRTTAYKIWEQEGCPEGQHDRHWEMAKEALILEKAASSVPPGAAKLKPADKM